MYVSIHLAVQPCKEILWLQILSPWCSKTQVTWKDILHPLAELYLLVCCLSLITPLFHQNNSTQKKYVLHTHSAWGKSKTTALWSQIHLFYFERIPLFFRFSLFLPSLECTRVPLLMPGDWLSNHVNPKPGFPPQACRHASSLIKRAYSAIYVSPCLHPLYPEDALGRKLKQTSTNKAHKYRTPINSRPKNVLMKRCKIWHTDTEKLLSMRSVLIWMRNNKHRDFLQSSQFLISFKTTKLNFVHVSKQWQRATILALLLC